MKSMKAALLATVAAIGLAGVSSANAAVILQYSVNGGLFQTVTDGQAGVDFNPTVGQITTFISGVLGASMFFETTNGTQTMLPSQLHLSVQGGAQAGAIGTLEILLTGTDYAVSSPGNYLLGANVTSTSFPSNTTLDYTAWVDDSNTAFGQATEIADVDITSEIVSPTIGGGGDQIWAFLDGTYSITERFLFTFSGSGARDTQAQGTVTVSVPEPATLALLGVGLLGMGLARRRKAA